MSATASVPGHDYAASTVDEAPARRFGGRYAIVTGGTQGLGLATTELLAHRGLAGAVICGRDADAGEALAPQLSGPGPLLVIAVTVDRGIERLASS